MLAPRRAVGPDLDQVERRSIADRHALRYLPRAATGVHQMSETDLRNLLTQLHARLGSGHTLDAEGHNHTNRIAG